MADPVLHLRAGPNGAGKSTLFRRVIGPITNLQFVNADELAGVGAPGASDGWFALSDFRAGLERTLGASAFVSSVSRRLARPGALHK